MSLRQYSRNKRARTTTGNSSSGTTSPWPKPEGELIPGLPSTTHMTVQEFRNLPSFKEASPSDGWKLHNSIAYNALLKVDMRPTRFALKSALATMGILQDTEYMLDQAEIRDLVFQAHPLYPDLVRQFLASATLWFKNESERRTSEGSLTYFIGGVKYTISLLELNDIYGFYVETENVMLLDAIQFDEASDLWNFIAKPVAEKKGRKLTLIRNPSIRCFAKFVGSIFFSKEESGSIRDDELYLLYCTTRRSLINAFITNPNRTMRERFSKAAVFAHCLANKKFHAFSTKGKQRYEYCGSLLTPIF